MIDLIPEIGNRALIVGQTGSGKTQFAVWMLPFLDHKFIIVYDSKVEDKFLTFDNVSLVDSVKAAHAEIKRIKKAKTPNDAQFFIVVRPDIDTSVDPELLDDMLLYHYQYMPNVACYIDETYTFHKGLNCGRGLMAILTRGRSKKITTIMSTQRPARLSRFCISESQKFYLFRLADKRDKKILSEIVPDFEKTKNPDRYYFYYYEYDLDDTVLFSPIKIENPIDTETIPEHNNRKVKLIF